ncbi:hypothetical protein [Alteromonas sp. a30]|uniref:hypothetical protein n=1 Tax=Alteromonas sp. a30 TaxID=2730917 RepID=UPI00227FFFB7|nr:hypothetical protein [Alteromonas sp. a30]MCY7294980.1 hypothetical protein [Alteromonas sp. a30]
MNLKNLLLLVSLLISKITYANTGKAIIPHWSGETSSQTFTSVYISNITDHIIDVSVKFYGDDGAAYSATHFDNFLNQNTQIAPKSTARVIMKPANRISGFAIIQWSNISADEDVNALMAHGIVVRANDGTKRTDISIPVNNGLPF